MNERIAAGSRVGRRRQRDAEREQAVGLETDRHARQAREALEQQAGADEQHQRQRDLGDHERVARSAPRRRRAAAAALQRVDRRLAGGERRGDQAEDEAGGQRDREREREHAAVDGDLGSARQAAQRRRRRGRRSRTRAARRATPPVSDEQQALAAHPARQVPAAGAEREPHRRLVRSRGRANEQQVRDVGARDQQHEADGAHQHEQRRSRAADRPLANRREPQARVGIGVGVGRVGARVGVGDGVHFALRLFDADARRDPRDRGQVAEAAGDQIPREAGDLVHPRRPHVHIVERRRQVDAERADDGVGRAVERQRRADRGGSCRRTGASSSGGR